MDLVRCWWSAVDYKEYGVLLVFTSIVFWLAYRFARTVLHGYWRREDHAGAAAALAAFIWLMGFKVGLAFAGYHFDSPVPLRYEQGGAVPICE